MYRILASAGNRGAFVITDDEKIYFSLGTAYGAIHEKDLKSWGEGSHGVKKVKEFAVKHEYTVHNPMPSVEELKDWPTVV